jgi:beta-lactamase regulating signal transducer with metallopeptidase domain
MSAHLLLEAAARSLVMGAMILVALRLLRIDQVRARRTAWLLALIGALAMPALVGAQIGPRLLPELTVPKRQSYLSLDEPYIAAAASSIYRQASAQHAPLIDAPRNESTDSAAIAQPPVSIVFTLALIGYCTVAAILSLRLCAGIGFALRLRDQAERVIFPFDPELDVRTSSRIATPVTIGSSVLLPRGYIAWDEATLRIVLSHERAHVRQADFYVHALAALHCALFWFNPFSWWLQRQLSELGEALSDCAAVGQAESRASYAETLLVFATRTRWPLTGVAMASSSNLTPRIERLLSDKGFERSFAVKQRLPYVAAGVVMLAMVASTSMTRVHASPTNGPVNAISIETNTNTNTNTNTDTDRNTNTDTNKNTNTDTNTNTNTNRGTGAADARSSKKSAGKTDTDSHFAEHDEAIGDSHEEGVMAIRTDHSRIMFHTGDLLPMQSGDYIYFQHDGKPYLIQDPAIIAQAQALLAPMKELQQKQEELGRKQKELGGKQGLLGAQQRILVAQARAVKIDTPEFTRDMANLQNMIKQMHVEELTAQIDRNALAEVQSHLGEIQATVGKLQAEMAMQQADFGAHQGELGAQQGELGAQQGKLGEQQALLGEQQRKIVEDVRRQLKPIIEQAIRDGKGKALAN